MCPVVWIIDLGYNRLVAISMHSAKIFCGESESFLFAALALFAVLVGVCRSVYFWFVV